MIPTGTEERRSDLKSNLLERLHNPMQLRLFLLVVVLAAGYFAVYVPLSGKIVETTKKLERDRKMLELAGSIEQLQKQFLKFDSRVPQLADSKEWVEYVMEGIRQLPVNLLSLNCRPAKTIGPYQAIILQVELQGTFLELDQVFRWVESNRRLLRADEVKLSPGHNARVMEMHLTLVAMTG